MTATRRSLARRTAGIVGVAGLLFALAAIPTRTNGAEPPDKKTHRLRVVDESNRPVAAAKIWIAEDYPTFPVCLPDRHPESASAESKPDGTARFDWPAGLKCNFLVRAPGFVPTFVRGVSPPADPDGPYTLHMKKGQPITGVVRHPDGKPIAAALVKAVPDKFLLDFMQEFIPTGETDDQGRFTLDHAAAARHTVTAVVELSDPPVYTESAVVDVPVDRPPAPIEMVAKPGAALKGRFVTTQDINLAGREVFLSIRLPKSVSRQIRTAPDGSFTADGIPPNALGLVGFHDVGQYIAVMEWKNPPAACRTDMAMVHFSSPPPGVYDGINVHLYKPAIFAATFKDEQGKPHEKLGVVVEPWNRIFYTDATGRLEAKVPPNVDVKIRYLNTSDEKVESVRLAEGEKVEREFTRARPPTPVYDREITGQVVDEKGAPVEGARVYVGNHGVVPQSEMRNHNPKPTWTWGTLFAASAPTDAKGQFTLNLLLPGKSDLWAVREPTHWGVMRDVDSNAKDLKFVLKPVGAPYRFAGTVSGAEGRPVDRARVCLFHMDNGQLLALTESRTGADGGFELKVDKYPSGRGREVRMVARSESGEVAWKVLPTCGMDDIRLQFKPPASVVGRLVNKGGQPLAGARVWLNYGQDPAMGNMMFHTDMLPLSPSTTTDAAGNYVLGNLPGGCTVSLIAKHPEYDRADVWYVKDLKPDTKIQDIVARNGITIEGTVRFADDRPAAGATVAVKGFNRTLATTTTDHKGFYRVVGLDNMSMRGSHVTATMGEGPQWEGSPEVQTTNLYSGDHVRGVDVVLQRSLVSRRTAWLAHKAPGPQSRTRVAVIDDTDPALEGKSSYDDNIALYDSAGQVLWREGGLGVAWGPVPVACDPNDRSIYVYEYLSRRLSKFGVDGKRLPWQAEAPPKGQSIASIAVDPENGEVGTLTSGGTIFGQNLVVYDGREGKKLREHKVAGGTIAYSRRDKCFWVTGKKLMKVGRDGKVLVEPSINFPWVSRQLAVNGEDGSVWVTDENHPEVHDSRNRLFVVNSDGQVRSQVDLGLRRPGKLVVDAPRGAAWVMFYPAGLTRMSLDGRTLSESPVMGDFVVEPDTGCVWVADEENLYRLAPDGKAIWSQASAKGTKTLLILNP